MACESENFLFYLEESDSFIEVNNKDEILATEEFSPSTGLEKWLTDVPSIKSPNRSKIMDKLAELRQEIRKEELKKAREISKQNNQRSDYINSASEFRRLVAEVSKMSGMTKFVGTKFVRLSSWLPGWENWFVRLSS